MADDELRYDRMVEEALRGVVGKALDHVIEHGLPGDHHFYITFRTDHPGVDIPDHLHKRYPDEMTIVLQHQFWDLEVGDEFFAVDLSFANRRERLTIPFAAVAAFADPSVRFGLQFDSGEGRVRETLGDDAAQADAEGEAEPSPHDEDGEPSEKVVTLDRFRKNKPA